MKYLLLTLIILASCIGKEITEQDWKASCSAMGILGAPYSPKKMGEMAKKMEMDYSVAFDALLDGNTHLPHYKKGRRMFFRNLAFAYWQEKAWKDFPGLHPDYFVQACMDRLEGKSMDDLGSKISTHEKYMLMEHVDFFRAVNESHYETFSL